MTSSTFPIIILNARPGAGKSEIIDFLKQVPLEERILKYHIGQFDVFDDFPILWSWFEEDALLEKMGFSRLHTDAGGYFTGQHLWHLLIKRLCQLYKKRLREYPKYHESHTAILEFSRGTEHGGYETAYQHLSQDVLGKAVVLYVQVSWAESLRKNRIRYNPERPDSILEHGLDDMKITRLYRHDDWMSLTESETDCLTINGAEVPSAIFKNEDDVTTERGEALGQRLEETLGNLWVRFNTHQDKSQ